MYGVHTDTLQELITETYDSKTPLMIYGPPGIGKSAIAKQSAKKFADQEKKKFVCWNEATFEDKKEMISNPDPYFVFADQRVAQMDPTDLRGIPNMVAGTEWLETIPMSWIVYFTQPKAHGIIFFDEINLAPPMVAAQAYQIIQERAAADRSLSPYAHIIAAGNRQQDKAYTFDMPFPLRDRFAEVEVFHSAEAWTNWAIANQVNSHLIAFIQWKESYLNKTDGKSADKASTPRGVVRASNLITGKDIESNRVHQLVSISCGEAFATEFQAYVKHFASLNWSTIYSNPKTVADFSNDKLFAVMGGLSENYLKVIRPVDASGSVDSKKAQDIFDKTMKVIQNMNADFAVSCLRMVKDTDVGEFKKYVRKCPDFKNLAKDYGKFIID